MTDTKNIKRKATGKFKELSRLLPACIGIIAAMAIVPQTYLSSGVFVPLAILTAYSAALFLFGGKGAPFILIAMALCIPGVSDEGNDFITSPVNANFFLFIRAAIVLFYLTYLIKYRKFGPIKSISIAIIVFALFYSAYLADLYELKKWINMLIYVPLFFLICKWDKATLKESFVFFDLLFISTLIYALLDFFFDVCPYTEIYDLSAQAEYFALNSFRARGLLSNPLMLSMIFLFYQVLLYIRMILFDQKVSVLFILSLFGCMICLSRTAIIGSLILFFYYMAVVKKFRSVKLIVTFVVIIASLAILTSILMNSFIGDMLSRFEEENVLESHRFSAYSSTFALLKDNVLGVGSDNVMTAIMAYAKNSLILDFTLDNFFLTILASYGILAIIPFEFFFHPFLKAFYRWGYLSYRPKPFHCFMLLFLCWCLIGMSFDLEEFVTTYLFVFGITGCLSGFVAREYGNSKMIKISGENEAGNNNSQLQEQ